MTPPAPRRIAAGLPLLLARAGLGGRVAPCPFSAADLPLAAASDPAPDAAPTRFGSRGRPFRDAPDRRGDPRRARAGRGRRSRRRGRAARRAGGRPSRPRPDPGRPGDLCRCCRARPRRRWRAFRLRPGWASPASAIRRRSALRAPSRAIRAFPGAAGRRPGRARGGGAGPGPRSATASPRSRASNTLWDPGPSGWSPASPSLPGRGRGGSRPQDRRL